MPSPFPGMDPFVEDQVWPEFHHNFISVLQETLMPSLRPLYTARVEERVYLEYDPPEAPWAVVADVTVLRELTRTGGGGGTATAVMAEPILIPLPMPVEMKEAYLEVRLRETHQVVTVIELLSPSNKRPGSKGQGEYLEKREAVLQSRTHLIEIDLLRAGARMPTAKPIPPCDYLALVCRGKRGRMAEVWPFSIRQRLPLIPVPLAGSDPDVPLDLQEVFNQLYDRTGYDYSIDYKADLTVPLAPENQDWLQEIVRQQQTTPGDSN